MPGSKFVYVTYIRITPEKLWHALTTPGIIKQYRFGMSVESEWKVGSTWRMYADGGLTDSGEILESISQKRLVMSWLNEWKPEFKAEGNSRCVYEIEPTGASAKLTLTHSIERPDSKFIGAVSEGWPMVISYAVFCLKKKKKLVETEAERQSPDCMLSTGRTVVVLIERCLLLSGGDGSTGCPVQ